MAGSSNGGQGRRASSWNPMRPKNHALIQSIQVSRFPLTNPHHLTLREPLDTAHRALVGGDRPITPFHWQIEFPEVFDRDTPGFDAIVGNPPFAGKNTIASSHCAGYPDWLKQI